MKSSAPVLKSLLFSLLALLVIKSLVVAHEQQPYLARFVPNLKYSDADLTAGTTTATYKAVFGEGDKNADMPNGISRVGLLTVEPGGASAIVSRPNEEYVLYVTEGKGTLIYDREKAPLKKNTFLYIPSGVRHGISNNSRKPIKVLFMGYHLPNGMPYNPKDELQIANADDVELQVLGSHGPTTQYKLLMGDTTSTRDRLASASLMKSLFIMNFSAHGTNNPHRHPTQEEVYFILRGHGYMIAGLDAYGNPVRHPSQVGDAYYWPAGSEMGFYSLNQEDEADSIILAIRADDPTKEQKKKK